MAPYRRIEKPTSEDIAGVLTELRELLRSEEARKDVSSVRVSAAIDYIQQIPVGSFDFIQLADVQDVGPFASCRVLTVSAYSGLAYFESPVSGTYASGGTTSFLLAIDDDRDRYDHLLRLVKKQVGLRVACCPEEVATQLRDPNLVGIFLDYDLDNFCRAHKGLKGTTYLDAVAAARVPVVVSSANYIGSRDLYTALKDAGVSVFFAPASETRDPEFSWLGFFWSEGAL